MKNEIPGHFLYKYRTSATILRAIMLFEIHDHTLESIAIQCKEWSKNISIA